MEHYQTQISRTAIKIHEAADLFPPLSESAYRELKEDIATYGQRVPIVMQEGYLLDGRHRYRACRELGIEPHLQELSATNEPVHCLVASLNLHRRHLLDGQRAIIAARLANLGIGGNQHTARAVSQTRAAADLNVSVDSLQRAKSVLKFGSHDLIKLVEAGDIGVSPAASIATLPENIQTKILQLSEKEILEKAKALRKAKTAARRSQIIESIEAKRANNSPLDPRSGPFDVIYADPPWDYMSETAVGYPTMSLSEICAMPVDQIASEDAVLFLWCSASLIREALTVIDAWGFTYKTQAVWDKMSKGTGCYFRVQHELLLFATRGTVPEVPPSSRPNSIFTFARREHSRKPSYAAELIEAMYPELSRVELFCRGEPRVGWAGWGNECPQSNAMKDPENATDEYNLEPACSEVNLITSRPIEVQVAENEDQFRLYGNGG